MVEVIKSKGCSRLSGGGLSSSSSSPFKALMSPAPATNSPVVRSTQPFNGLVICVTGLSKEARKQVMEATERLGGQYSPHLHPQCTHLVVQIFGREKFEHALKHGSTNGLLLRLSESLYSIKSMGHNGIRLDELNRLVGYSGAQNSCLPVGVYGTKQLSTIEVAKSFGRESRICNGK